MPIILLFLAVGFGLLGLAYRLRTSSPAIVPSPPQLALRVQPAPRTLTIHAFLMRTDKGDVQLAINATGTFEPTETTAEWNLDVQQFSGSPCTPAPGSSSLVAAVRTLKQEPATLRGRVLANGYEISGTSAIPPPATFSQPFAYMQLCWRTKAPLVTTGSYLSASLPRILTSPGQHGTVTRALELKGHAISEYSLVGGAAPTEATGRGWVWTSDLSDSFESQASNEIPVIASSLPGLQRDNTNTFLSGIFLGIAGSAAIAVVPELLHLARRSQEQREQAGPG